MTQHSNREPYAPWGEPVRTQPNPWWATLVTVPALVRHIVLMFTVMAVLTALNLIATPGTFWSLALLVVWVVVLVAHGLGLLAVRLLVDDQGPQRPAVPRVKAEPEPNGRGYPSWTSGSRNDPQPGVPGSWELTDDEPAGWPAPPPPRQHTQQQDEPEVPEQADEEPANERGSWRAVTDIAWLRGPRDDNGASDQPATERDREASS